MAHYSCKNFNSEFKCLNEQVHSSLSDYLFLFFYICEIFQIISLLPKESLIHKITNGLLFNLGLNIISALNLTFQDYWFYYRLVCGVSILSSLLSLAVVIFKKKLFKGSSYFKYLEFISEFILPTLGHIGFMPILSSLLTIFSCEEGSSDHTLDSFLTQDCSQYCYSGSHIYYSIVSTLAILFHLLFFIYLRPFWESAQPSLHIHSSAKYLSALSLFQVVLALLS